MASSTQQQTSQCTYFSRPFTTGRGLGRHQAEHNRQEGSAADSIPTDRALSISLADTSAIDSVIRANLHPFLPDNPIPTQAHNIISGADFANSINAIYEEIISWRKNLFSIPSRQRQKSHTTTIRMVDSLKQQNLLSKDCSKSLHGRSSSIDAETLSQKCS